MPENGEFRALSGKFHDEVDGFLAAADFYIKEKSN
jgi:hypothetical protein